MAGRAMNERIRLALFCLLAQLAVLTPGCSSSAPEAPPLAGASIGGPFALTNQDGGTTRDSDFAGRYRLVYFGFTHCPDVCPVDVQVIAQGLRQLEKSAPSAAARVQPIFITVDPERDTPPVLKEFVSAFHPRLIGLTGTPEQLADVAKRFGIYYGRDQREGMQGYNVDHSRTILLFGPQGEPIAIIPHNEGPDAVAAELRRWVR
jgi:protein SCO1